MAKFTYSVNEKLCKSALKSANSSMDKIKKYIGSGGTKKTSTVIGCVEKLNEGFKDSGDVAQLYNNFNDSLKVLKSRLNEIDAAFEVIDKVV